MADQPNNALSRFERQRPNYPLMVIGGVLFLCLVAGLAVSMNSAVWLASALFFLALFICVTAVFLILSRDRRLAGAEDRKLISWDSAPPELQRQNVNIEVRELARLLRVQDGQMTDLLSAYIVAQDLALRQIQLEENLPLLRNVSIGNAPFDAILIEQDTITCIEVSFLVVPDVRQEKIDSMLKKIALAKKNLAERKLRLRLKLLLVLVLQLDVDDEEILVKNLDTKRFTEGPNHMTIARLDFETLQKDYLSD